MTQKERPMPKSKTIAMEALKRFRHDGAEIEPGLLIQVAAIDADELAALGFARRTES